MDERNFGDKAHKLTPEENARGGRKSGETKRRKKDLRACLEELLEREYKDADGNKLSGAEAICAKIFSQALKGDKRAFELIRDTAGQKPVEKVMVADVDQETIDEIEKIINEQEETQ